MTRQSLLALTLMIALISITTPVTAVITPSGIDPRLRLEWDAVVGRGGRPVITGYVHNDNGRVAMNVRLLAESLDATGQVVDRAIGFVPDTIPVMNRSQFWVPLRVTGASYRVTVTSFEWRDCGI